MYKSLDSLLHATLIVASLSLAGCSSDKTADTATPGKDAGCPAEEGGCPAKDGGCPAKDGGCPASGDGGTTSGPVNAGTADLPATGAEGDIKAWLSLGEYKKGNWKCEAAPHAARSPSPHGTNRICSNATLSEHGAGEFPVGAAGVKEIYDGATITGYSMYRKLKAGGGEAWYWYEELAGSNVANDTGDLGTAKSVCVGCHAGAGSDAMHSGHDQVYTQVK